MTTYLVPRFASTPRAAARLMLATSIALAICATAIANFGLSSPEVADAKPSMTAESMPPISAPGSAEATVIAGIEVSAEDGFIPDGESLSPFDDEAPAIANLDPDLRDAVQQAATDARVDGIRLEINSGWRSETYQQALLDDAIVTYGSEEEARKWVDTPKRSSHVTGMAVDIGPTDADYWMIEHGSDYGLCQTYANEIWHFELMTTPGGTCPAPVEDAAAR